MSVTLLDGGMGRELKRLGASFRQPEWSALALMEAPEAVTRAHQVFVDAGADVITTNSYAVVPFHLGAERFDQDGEALAGLSGRLARAAADGGLAPVRVAGSLPPLFGSYRPDLFDPARAQAILAPLVAGLAPHVDIWLAETLGSLAEAEMVLATVGGRDTPVWISFTLEDDAADVVTGPRLRSGEPVAAAAELMIRCGVSALLFNCSQPEVMAPALRAAGTVREWAERPLALGAYANGFPPMPKTAQANEDNTALRSDLDADAYLGFARAWVETGAEIIGGCCGIGPEHIAALRRNWPQAVEV